MPAINLTTAERKAHRADAHHLDPVVLIGGDGLTPGVTKEIDTALQAHGLIKVRVFSDDREQRAAFLAQLCDELSAAPIQQIGKLLVLWRPPVAKEKVEREDGGAGPKIVKVVKFSKSGNHRPQIKKVRLLGNQRVTPGGNIRRAKKRRAVSVKRTQQD